MSFRRTRKPHSHRVLAPSTCVAFPFSDCFPLTSPTKPFPLNLFADPHPLSLYPTILYKNSGGRGCYVSSTSNVHRSDVSTCLASPIPSLFMLLRTLLRFLAQVQKPTPFVSSDSALFAPKKAPRWGDTTFNLQTFKRSPVPLRPNAFGATIPKGTRFLYDPGKQLRSPRCLRIRERTSGTARVWSPLQVVPGSSVLRRVSGFALINPEQAGFRVCTYKP